MRYFIKKLLYFFVGFVFNKTIVFESAPDISDNTFQIYKMFLTNNLNKRYKMCWLLFDKDGNYSYDKNNNTIFIPKKCRIRFFFYSNFAHYYIACNRALFGINKKQKSIYLGHGTPIKKTSSYFTVPNNVSYQIAQSPNVEELVAEQTNYDRKRVVGLGYPRNDAFFCKKILKLSDIFGEFDKYIVWYPTFRKYYGKGEHKPGEGNYIPLLSDSKSIMRLNSFLKSINCFVVIKPHFARTLNIDLNASYSNIAFIKDSFFKEHNITSYCFLSLFDALITDYSSVYFDYLLCDKPICMIWDDFDYYNKYNGFVENYNYLCSAATKVYSMEDLFAFVTSLKGNEPAENQIKRSKLSKYVNCSLEGDNSQRVFSFIVDKFGL